MLFTHALVPSAFRLQVSAMIQESPSKFFLTASGILKPRHAAHWSKTPIAGALTRPGDRNAGNWYRNGSGTSAWSWGISCILIPCARPSLLLPSHLLHPLRLFHRTRLLPRAMLPLTWACAGRAGRFSGQDFALQPDGTLRCQASQKLIPHEQRREADGSLRVVYGASIRSCRPCPLRKPRQWNGTATTKPRQVSVLLHPLTVGGAPLFWHDWSRRQHRRACMQLVRDQHLEVRQAHSPPSQSSPGPAIHTLAQRAHFRLSWDERLTRNASGPANGQVRIKLFGVPDQFADFLGLRAG